MKVAAEAASIMYGDVMREGRCCVSPSISTRHASPDLLILYDYNVCGCTPCCSIPIHGGIIPASVSSII